MASHNIFIFGSSTHGGNSLGNPFGSAIINEEQDFIAPQIHPFIKNGINLKLLKCGYAHTILITNENNIIWFGQMDDRTDTIEEIKWNFNNIVDVRSGEFCNLFLTSNGHVVGWGNNNFGALGFGEYNSFILTPTINDELNEIIAIELK